MRQKLAPIAISELQLALDAVGLYVWMREVETALQFNRRGKMAATISSPLTGVIEETDVIIDFGQYEGQSVERVRAMDPKFIDQLVREKEAQNLAIRRHRDKSFRLYMNPLTERNQ